MTREERNKLKQRLCDCYYNRYNINTDSLSDIIREMDEMDIDTEDFDDNQLSEICKGVTAGLTKDEIALYADPKFNYKQMECIFAGLSDDDGYVSYNEVMTYANKKYSADQMNAILTGYKDGIDASIYANPKYDSDHMQQALAGLKEGLTIENMQRYLNNPSLTLSEIEESRKNLVDLNQRIMNDYYKNYYSSCPNTDRIADMIEHINNLNINTNEFDDNQFLQICRGIDDGLDKYDIEVYADPKFDSEQMDCIRMGLNDRTLSTNKVCIYADEHYNTDQMIAILVGLQAGLNVEQYARPSRSSQSMDSARAELGAERNAEDEEKYSSMMNKLHEAKESGVLDVETLKQIVHDTGLHFANEAEYPYIEYDRKYDTVRIVNNLQQKDDHRSSLYAYMSAYSFRCDSFDFVDYVSDANEKEKENAKKTLNDFVHGMSTDIVSFLEPKDNYGDRREYYVNVYNNNHDNIVNIRTANRYNHDDPDDVNIHLQGFYQQLTADGETSTESLEKANAKEKLSPYFNKYLRSYIEDAKANHAYHQIDTWNKAYTKVWEIDDQCVLSEEGKIIKPTEWEHDVYTSFDNCTTYEAFVNFVLKNNSGVNEILKNNESYKDFDDFRVDALYHEFGEDDFDFSVEFCEDGSYNFANVETFEPDDSWEKYEEDTEENPEEDEELFEYEEESNPRKTERDQEEKQNSNETSHRQVPVNFEKMASEAEKSKNDSENKKEDSPAD